MQAPGCLPVPLLRVWSAASNRPSLCLGDLTCKMGVIAVPAAGDSVSSNGVHTHQELRPVTDIH